ncbi:hypothetical protein ACIRO1_36485 [Streptomyces sp. NPDC102381]|uniref:hypothetical protein n=1 Tax=Streptomyces sp. NPDC102381 TaxID=3366164 RepID=UPI00382589AB
MIVWRVGHSKALDDGVPSGPYTCKNVDEKSSVRLWGMAGDHSNSTHPSPYADPLLRGIASYERCGFNSREALNTWFDGWIEALDSAGFEVWSYEVPDWAARVGRHGQVVFDGREAVEQSRHTFTPEQAALFN